jgi:hypothetical protein
MKRGPVSSGGHMIRVGRPNPSSQSRQVGPSGERTKARDTLQETGEASRAMTGQRFVHVG